MNKQVFFDALIDELNRELALAVSASKDAADYATNEESRADSQWDTQGLEASYLAAGQASQARVWVEAIEELTVDRSEVLKTKILIAVGSLFECDLGGSAEWFFYSGVAGGQTVTVEGVEVTVITTQSPLAARVRGRKAGDSFKLPNGNYGVINSVE